MRKVIRPIKVRLKDSRLLRHRHGVDPANHAAPGTTGETYNTHDRETLVYWDDGSYQYVAVQDLEVLGYA